MKIYLASFLEPENHGPGRLISIVKGNKPKDLEVKFIFHPFIPSINLDLEYETLKYTGKIKEAGAKFEKGYQEQLDNFVKEVEEESKKLNKKPADILPFLEGDTLCSWERSDRYNYRKVLVSFLEKLNYEVNCG